MSGAGNGVDEMQRHTGGDTISRPLVLVKLLSWTPGSGPRCIIQIVPLKQDYAFEDVCAFFHRCANSVAFASVLRMSPCVIWWTTGARVSL